MAASLRQLMADLDSVLSSIPGAMPTYEAMGMMAAHASAPCLTSPSVWVQHVLGDASFASEQTARDGIGAIMTTYNAVVKGLEKRRNIAPPLDDAEAVEAWCRGYIEVAYVDEIWMEDEEAARMLVPFAALGGDHGPLLARHSLDAVNAQKAEWRSELPARIEELHKYLAPHRRATAGQMKPGGSGTVRRDGPKVGRNAPCPCGSGRKYKRCCGAH